jgi:nucleotide-binding universal stress UspA family protein
MAEKFRTVLVPHDFSTHATRALALAASLVGRGGRILVLHVVERFGNKLVQKRQVVVARRALARVTAAAARARGGVRVTARLVVGDPYQRICDAGRGADCIVMCTAGRTGLRHLVIGSVAEKVVRHAPVPVLTFRPDARVSKPLFRSVLVPHDLSAPARGALRVAASLVEPGGWLRVVSVVAFPDTVELRRVDGLVADDRAELTRLVARDLAGGTHRVECRVEVGNPYRQIMRAARGVDSIVMSTLGRSGFAQLLIGSVAEKMVRHAPVPVLTIRAGARRRA